MFIPRLVSSFACRGRRHRGSDLGFTVLLWLGLIPVAAVVGAIGRAIGPLPDWLGWVPFGVMVTAGFVALWVWYRRVVAQEEAEAQLPPDFPEADQLPVPNPKGPFPWRPYD